MEAFLIAARFFHFSAAIVLAGVFAFERLVADPTFRQSGRAPAGGPRIRRRLGWLAWAVLVLAIGSGAAWLVAVAAGMSGKPLGAASSALPCGQSAWARQLRSTGMIVSLTSREPSGRQNTSCWPGRRQTLPECVTSTTQGLGKFAISTLDRITPYSLRWPLTSAASALETSTPPSLALPGARS